MSGPECRASRAARLAPLLLALVASAAPSTRAQDLSAVTDFWYRLQGLGGNPLDVAELAADHHELLILDASKDGSADGEFTPEELDAIRGGDASTILLAYVSIGEASDFRWYWDELTTHWSHVLGPVNPAFPESRKVRYWLDDWKQFIIGDDVPGGLGRSYVERVVDAGFDGVYLDIIDAFETFGPWGKNEKPDAASEMITFVEEIAEYARVTLGKPGFLVVPQNGTGIIDLDQFAWADDPESQAALELARYVSVIDGLGLEDVFHLGKLDENNKPESDPFRDEHIATFLAQDVPCFATEYLSAFRPNPKKLAFPQVVLDLQAAAAAFGDEHGVPGAALRVITQVRDLDRPSSDPLAVPNARWTTAFAVGQPDTLATAQGAGAAGLSRPAAALVADDRLLVADTGHHRVLVFDTLPDASGAGADRVLGQVDLDATQKSQGGLSGMNAPQGLAWNGTQLFVADTGNHRVLVWDGIPADDGAPLDFVLGQVDPSGAQPGVGLHMRGPTGLAASADRLWVCDTRNHRVLGFDLPIALTVTASVVLGQGDLEGRSPGDDADRLRRPRGVAVSPGGRLAVADTGNHRVLVWDEQPVATGTPADRVLGQEDFGVRRPGTSDLRLRAPSGVAWLDDDTLLVTDAANNRLGLWTSTLPGAPMADVVGQPTLFGRKPGQGALGLRRPSGAVPGPDGTLFVVDGRRHRVLGLVPAVD